MPAEPWTDDSVMPWGAHKGKRLRDIQPSYLLWLFEQPWIKDYAGLHAYLKKNEDLLMEEKREGSDDNGRDFTSYDDYKNYR